MQRTSPLDRSAPSLRTGLLPHGDLQRLKRARSARIPAGLKIEGHSVGDPIAGDRGAEASVRSKQGSSWATDPNVEWTRGVRQDRGGAQSGRGDDGVRTGLELQYGAVVDEGRHRAQGVLGRCVAMRLQVEAHAVRDPFPGQ